MAKVRVFNPAPSRADLLEENRKLRDQIEELKRRTNRANSPRGNSMSGRADLLAQIKALQKENDDLQDKLDHIADRASAPDDGQQQTKDDLIDALNEILDIAAPDATDEDDQGNE